MADEPGDGDGDLEPFTDTALYALGAYFADRHPELMDDVVAQAQQQLERDGSTRALQIARLMLDGEIAAQEKKYDEAIKHLNAAVKIEAGLRYDEPPDWTIPVRHALGAALLNVGRVQEAEQVYRDDLKLQPNNGWSLFGLFDSLRRQDKSDEAIEVEKQFNSVWAKADTRIDSSCLCQPAVR